MIRRTRRRTKAVQTRINHNYTISCLDGEGRSVSFRDITGKDLELLDLILSKDSDRVESSHVIDILSLLCTNSGANFYRFTPKIIGKLYEEVTTHILKNYISKENWLRQCFSIQNGSFQNLDAMEHVPMSKFVAMCQIHKEAIDQLNTPAAVNSSEVQ